MDKALRIERGSETLVSASAIQAEFHGRNPWGVKFICPFCRQPLNPASMGYGGSQAPHFRHERGNERAHECEMYASSVGYYAMYQRAPMPMFIRKSRANEGEYIVEVGFRSIDPLLLSDMERLGAQVCIGLKSYRVTRQRFGQGFTKLPLEELSLTTGSLVRLIGCRETLGSTWGYPEDATCAMVFSRDPDTSQGKRLKTGDTLVFETDYFLLTTERNKELLLSAFPSARFVGFTGGRSQFSRLAVFEVVLSKAEENWHSAKVFLERCGFEVADHGNTPELIWPPALMSGGELRPLFELSKCVFVTDMASSDDKKLYVHTNADTAEKVRTLALIRSINSEFGYSILKNTYDMSFVTARNWVFSSAVLLRQNHALIDEWLKKVEVEPLVIQSDDGAVRIELRTPGKIICLCRNRANKTVKITEAAQSVELERNTIDAIRVYRALHESLGDLLICEFEIERNVEQSDVEYTDDVGFGEIVDRAVDYVRAVSRQQGKSRLVGVSCDKEKALLRANLAAGRKQR